jgi:hypothetical protein
MASTAPATTDKAVKTSVQMKDGRTVEFTTKQKLNKESSIAEDGTITGRFDFRNGETISFIMPANLVARFAAHGMEQKIGDSIAGEADLDDAVVSMSDLVTRLQNGEWTAARKAGSFAGSSILIRALFELKGATTDEAKQKIKAWLDTKSQAEKIALRKSSGLAPIVERLEKEKAATAKPGVNVDTDALLGELDTAPAEDAPTKSKGK